MPRYTAEDFSERSAVFYRQRQEFDGTVRLRIARAILKHLQGEE